MDKDVSNQLLITKSIRNARELGGYKSIDGRTIKHRTLLRTAHLNCVSDDDIKILQNIYHLRYIIDLRNDDEKKRQPDRTIPGAMYIPLNVLYGSQEDDVNKAITQYNKDGEFHDITSFFIITAQYYIRTSYAQIIASDSCKESFRTFMNILLENKGGAVLYHCSGGKDRTGVFSAILLSLLGVEKPIIYKDYLMTNIVTADRIKKVCDEAKTRTTNHVIIDNIPKLVGVSKELLDAMFLYVENKDGSMINYVKKEMKITDEEITLLRDKYLE